MDLQIWARNSVLVADREPSRSGAVARLRGRPPPPPPPPSAQVTGSDPGTDRESSSALNGPTYATYTTNTCTNPPQLLHLFYDSKAQIFKGWLSVNKQLEGAITEEGGGGERMPAKWFNLLLSELPLL